VGLFITFEGIEGSGKTTQIQRLKGYVEQKGFPCRITREPGGSRVGERMVLICDRFHDATVAYQGYGRGMALDLIEGLNQTVTKGVKPNLTILLDCPVEVGLERAKERIEATDPSWKEGRFEAERRDFHQRVRDGYLTIAKAEPHRVKVVNGSRDEGTVEREIRQLVNRFLK